MSGKRLTRRGLLRSAGVAGAAGLLAACQPAVVEKVVEQTVVVTQEKVVEKVVEKEVTRVVEPKVVRWAGQPSPRAYDATYKLLAAFEEESGIRIKMEPFPGGWAGVNEAMLAGFAAGDAPDLFIQYGPFARKCIDKGITLALDPFWDRDNMDLSIYVQSQLEAGELDGVHYGMGWYCGMWAAYYNVEIFDENGLDHPDETWNADKMMEAMAKITKRDADGNPERLGGVVNYSLVFGLSANTWSWGGEIYDPKDRRICRMTDERTMECLQWLADLRWKYGYAPTPVENQALTTIQGVFQSGNAGITEGGSWFINEGNAALAIGDKFVYDSMPQAAGPDGKRETWSTTDLWLVNKKTPDPDASWEALKMFTSERYVRLLMEFYSLQPIIKSMGPDWVAHMRNFLATVNPKLENMTLDHFVTGYEYARPMMWFHRHSEAMEILQPVLDQIYVTGSASVAEVIPEACEKVTTLLTTPA